MALKDWVLYSKTEDMITYRKKTSSSFLTIMKVEPSIIGSQKGYLVSLNSGEGFHRFFKTKSEALKYAKSYMRKN